MDAEEKPPSLQNITGTCGPARNSGVDFSDLYRIPIWRGGNLTGMGIRGSFGNHSLHKHKAVDLVLGKNN